MIACDWNVLIKMRNEISTKAFMGCPIYIMLETRCQNRVERCCEIRRLTLLELNFIFYI